jgi:hypothetical protein
VFLQPSVDEHACGSTICQALEVVLPMPEISSLCLQVHDLERQLAAEVRVLHQSLQAQGSSSIAAGACAAAEDGCDAAAQQQAEAAEAALATSDATVVRLDASLAPEQRVLRAATDAQDAAQQELSQAEKRYQRCTAAQALQSRRPMQAADGAAGGNPSPGARRQLQVTLRLQRSRHADALQRLQDVKLLPCLRHAQ